MDVVCSVSQAEIDLNWMSRKLDLHCLQKQPPFLFRLKRKKKGDNEQDVSMFRERDEGKWEEKNQILIKIKEIYWKQTKTLYSSEQGKKSEFLKNGK